MINKNLIHKEIQQYIIDNLKSNLSELRIKKSPFKEVTSLEIVQQIQGKKIAQTKFPFLYHNEMVIYPLHLNLEQASSQSTALFKQKIISGKIGIDLTGGAGIDSFFLSEYTNEFYYIEPNRELLEIVKHNFSILSRKNTLCINKTAEEFLSENITNFDFIYLDPSRRDENKNKKILLEDLTPNIIEIQKQLLQFSKSIFIKLSPLLDLQQTIHLLPVSNIFIISVKNETKELIIQLKSDKTLYNKNPYIQCINLNTQQPDFSFYWQEEKLSEIPEYSSPQSYLYIPNASILKSGAFKLVSHKFKLKKLHSNSHIYTSENKIDNFPGRIFTIINKNFNPKKSEQKKFNIISRNYPLKTEEIIKKYKLTEGGEEFLIFTRSIKENVCILAEISQ